MSHKKLKKIKNISSAGCSLMRAEGFAYKFDVLYGGLGIYKLHFLIKKIHEFFSDKMRQFRVPWKIKWGKNLQ
jgi:hypothetical protein